jgi:transcriptional regulator with XRE-family HTH domain
MDEATRRHWAGRVRTLRGDLTQEQLARKASRGGVTVTSRTIRDMERGTRVPHVEKLLAVLDALGVDYERRDPSLDEDLESLTALVVNLVRRLPAESRDARAELIVEDLATRIREAAADLHVESSAEERAAYRREKSAARPEVGVDEAAARRDRDDVAGRAKDA